MFCSELNGGLFDVHPPDIGGPFQGLGEALAAVEHRASLAPSCFPCSRAPAAKTFLVPSPAAEASSNPPPADEDWMKEQREKGRTLKLYLSQLDPDEVLQSVRSTLMMMANDAEMDTKPAKQPVEKSQMDAVIEKLTPKTTDPDILKARYRFERLVEKRETIKNGMKLMQHDVGAA